jgi:hypothetical protein
MSSSKWRLLLCAVMLAIAHQRAEAQALGTFRWQLAPYCNTLTLAIEARGEFFALQGYDDMCGGPKRGGATGTAQTNSDGTIGLSISVVRPDGFSVQHVATVTPAALTGTWTDEYGNAGTFSFNAPSPATGSPRPVTLRGSYTARVNNSASTTTGTTDISYGRLLPFTPQPRVIRFGMPVSAECPGTGAVPQAAPGFLCVYERSGDNVSGVAVLSSEFGVNVTDRVGAVLVTGAGVGSSHSSGTWAVTLPQ